MAPHSSSVVAACKKFLQKRGAPEGAATMVVLRELISNANEHGNRNADKSGVYARIEHLGDSHFAVTVQDNGEGFDHALVAKRSLPEDPRKMCHRGYFLIRILADRIEFNEKGNHITAYVTEAKRLQTKTAETDV
jgi:anti-sigma regulatory factor (Ser/Thr protein kinase)